MLARFTTIFIKPSLKFSQYMNDPDVRSDQGKATISMINDVFKPIIPTPWEIGDRDEVADLDPAIVSNIPEEALDLAP